MKLDEINVRDPYIFADNRTKKYYMYASQPLGMPKGFCVYVSDDLENWEKPITVFEKGNDFWATEDFWAPEVHEYRGKYYLFGTFSSEERLRTSQILVSESLRGPFRVHSKPLAPDNWYSLDATLYIEDGKPYAVFSHEWVQVGDGEMCCVPLSDDLTAATGEIRTLFKASESGWAKCPIWNNQINEVYVVDAPFLYNIDGVEFLLWSSWSKEDVDGYSVGVAYPTDGILGGNYIHKLLKLPKDNCGHAMVFKDFEGNNRIVFHCNNCLGGMERASILYIKVLNGEVKAYEKENY